MGRAIQVTTMWCRDDMRGRIALLIVAAVLAIVLAVIEALAAHRTPPQAVTGTWVPHLRRVDEALRRNDVGVATQAWQDAYVAALGSRRWEGMLAVGDAALRVGQASRTRMAATTLAHHAYLSALLRAREDGSLDGILHAGEAFAALGDTAFAMYCLRIAEPLMAVEREGVDASPPSPRNGL